MSHLADNDIGGILDNYADVIEGGNSYRGSGTSYTGIPGAYPFDRELRLENENTLTASANGTSTTIKYASGNWDSSRWVKTDTPAFFVISTSGDNEDEARRITGWNNTTKVFTVDELSNASAQNDTFNVAQGFKRLREGDDVEAKELKTGYDRVFSFKVESPGEELGFYGAGTATYETELKLYLRILKYNREQDARKSIFTNMIILREGLVKGTHRAGLVRALIPIGSTEIEEDDTHKIVAVQNFKLIYRVVTTFK